MRPLHTLIVCLLTVAAGCARGREYELQGQVVAVDRARQELTIKHGDIRGFMPGMTMAFRVKDGQLMEGRTPGDLVTAALVVENDAAYLSSVRVTGHAPLTEPAPASRVDILAPGAPVAPVRFTDEAGVVRRLADWRGRVVVVTFIYTRCPLPDFCPRMDQAFAALQQAVRADRTLANRVVLLSVSIDPEFDTAAVLAAHARRAGAEPGIWHFATGDRQAIDTFAAQFGVSVFHDASEGGALTHNLRTAVIAPDGTLAAVRPGSDWTAAMLLEDVRRAGV